MNLPFMIPEFPQFKKLELSDRKDLEKFTSKFPPYSDFNFVSMWAWDTKGEMQISQLNGNLVVQFTDYINGKPFFSFLGDSLVLDTIKTLLDFSKKNFDKIKLKLVPEKCVERVSLDEFDVVSDENAYDYVYEVSHLANMHNWTQNTSGKQVRSFVRSFPNYVVKHNSVKEVKKQDYLDIFNKWAQNKNIKESVILNEYIALNRIFKEGLE
ncbi:MAG: hypothetical protein AAB438_01465, partial [Patescibacteria group bacterium]